MQNLLLLIALKVFSMYEYMSIATLLIKWQSSAFQYFITWSQTKGGKSTNGCAIKPQLDSYYCKVLLMFSNVNLLLILLPHGFDYKLRWPSRIWFASRFQPANGCPQEQTKHIQSQLEKLAMLRMDSAEFSCLKALVLFSPGKGYKKHVLLYYTCRYSGTNTSELRTCFTISHMLFQESTRTDTSGNKKFVAEIECSVNYIQTVI